MPTYSFTAVSKNGEPYSGKQEAKDEYELARALRQEGRTLISAEPEAAFKKREISLRISFGVSLTEKIIFARNLAVMIGAGLPLPRTLKLLSEQAQNKKFKDILLKVAEEVIKGKNLSDGLARHPDVFSELFVNMVKVGEESGTLQEVLGGLTSQMEKEYELRSKIKGAMVYPSVIILAMLGVGILMLVTVVPKLAETFKELNIELPITTQIMIAFAQFLSQKWYLFILVVFILVFLFRFGLKTKKGGKTFSWLTLRIPVISPLVKKTNTASALGTFSALVASGVPIVRSLEIVSRTLGNFYFKQSLAGAATEVQKGRKLSESLKPYQEIYPALVIQMLEIGEETGQTSSILKKLADFYEAEVANATKNLSAIIEPILMLVIGAAVGFFAVSMIQPMYSMMGTL